MACEGFGLLLSRYVDGEGTPEERASVERHVAMCAGCRAEMKEFEQHEALVASALSSGPFGDRIVSRVQSVLQTRAAARRPDLRTVEGWRIVWGRVRPVVTAPQNLAAAALLLASAGLYADSLGIVSQNRALQQKVTSLEQAIVVIQRQQASPVVRSSRDGTPAPTPPVSSPTARPPGTSVATASTEPDSSSEPAEGRLSPGRKPETPSGLPSMMLSVLPQPEGNRVYWSVEHAPVGTQYALYRRSDADSDFLGPLNLESMDGFEFVDARVDPLRTYWYKVRATHEDQPVLETPPVVVLSQGSLEIFYTGTMGEAGVTKDRAGFKVRRLVDGQWVESYFRVALGQGVGGKAMCRPLGREFDFASGYTLREIGPAPQEKTYFKEVFAPDPKSGRPARQFIPETYTSTAIRVLLEGPKGEKVELFSGQSHIGVAP
ncbi:MAG: zf-HC2 domain-containing protein [Planctomycetes bacterium]|nr:zf-HC2 domain-containing protein [Planctomycetota bacterium]